MYISVCMYIHIHVYKGSGCSGCGGRDMQPLPLLLLHSLACFGVSSVRVCVCVGENYIYTHIYTQR